MRQLVHCLALFALVTACASRQPAPPSPVAQADRLRSSDTPPLPRALRGFQVTDTFTFEEPNSGVQYRYAGDSSMRPDVYLYPLPPQGYLCAGQCAVEAARAEASQFIASFPAFIERGYADSMILVSEEDIVPPAQSWLALGRHIRLRLVRQGTAFDSHYFVFAGHETFLKVRATFPPDPATWQELTRFVQALLAATPAPFTCRLGLASAPGISVATTRFGPPEPLAHVLDSVLASGHTLDYRSERFGAWRTVPQFGPLPGCTTGATQAGGILFASVTVAGDSTTATVTGQNACRTPSSKAGKESASVGPMLGALATMAALDSALGH